MKKVEGTHKSLNMLVCDRCGWKASYTHTGRSVMRDHLAAKHAPAVEPAEPAAKNED